MLLITVGAAREQHSLAAEAGRSGALHARRQQRPRDLAPAHWPASHLSGPTGLHPTCLHPRCSRSCGLPCSLQGNNRLCFLCWSPKQDCGLEGMPPLPLGLLSPSAADRRRAEAGRELLCRNQLTCARPQGRNWASWMTPWLGLSSLQI